MWFLAVETGTAMLFAVLWGADSDATGRRLPLIILSALGGTAAYLLLALVPALEIGFAGALVLRAAGGACTAGALSLGLTTLMDLTGGNGRNMGAAGSAIGLGAAAGSVLGGLLGAVGPLVPLYRRNRASASGSDGRRSLP